MRFDESQVTASLNGVVVPAINIKYYELNEDGSYGNELALDAIQAINVSDTKEYGVRIEADNFEVYETTFKMTVNRRSVSITLPSTSTQNGQSLTADQLNGLVNEALANATTPNQGTAIINDTDLGDVTMALTNSIYDVDGIHNDVLSLIFTVLGESGNIEITPENGVANILINNNYEITVFYGDVEVESLPEVVTPTPVVVEPLTDDNVTETPDGDATETNPDDQEDNEVDSEVDEDEDTPTPSIPEFGNDSGIDNWALLNLILSIISIVYTIYLVITKKKTKEETIEDEKVEQVIRRKGPTMAVNALASIVAVVLFIMTQDITKPMIILDIWTIAFVLVVVVQFVVVMISKKNVESDNQY